MAGTNTNFIKRPSDLGHTTKNYLGKGQKSDDPMLKGAIDDFKIYSATLSDLQIAVMSSSTSLTGLSTTENQVEVVLSGAETETVSAPGVLVYPNPASGVFQVELNGLNPGKAMLSIIDGKGEKVLQQSVEVTGKNQLVNVNLSHCSDGVYFLQVITDERVHQAKVVLR